jgi:hypothetical protein
LDFQDSIVLQSVFTNAREKLTKEWEENDDNDDDDVEEDEPITPSSRLVLKLTFSAIFNPASAAARFEP